MRRKSEIRQSVAVSVLLAAVLFAVPLMLASPAGRQLFSSETQPVETEPFVPGELDSATVLKVLDGDTVREMTMGEYLTGVLRAEMPASFEEEALKAQAVAARTYTLYKMITGGNHGDTADICTDSTCCQAYLSEEQALENWGDNAGAYQAKIRTAVKETPFPIITAGRTLPPRNFVRRCSRPTRRRTSPARRTPGSPTRSPTAPAVWRPFP